VEVPVGKAPPKDIDISFIGSTHGEVRNQLRQRQDKFFEDFEASSEWRDIIRRSKFTLAPRGASQARKNPISLNPEAMVHAVRWVKWKSAAGSEVDFRIVI
jgi:hypothetical protein